jgi:hypothetical protein
MHDDFCPMTQEDAAACEMCKLISRVRRDEQDKYSGDEEWDRQVVAEEAYARGVADERKNVSKAAPAASAAGGLSLDTIHKYIMDGVARRNVGDTEVLYNLYVHLGGK